MPMGLHGAPSSFARLMDTVMSNLPGVITYIDDVLVHSSTYSQHLDDLRAALSRLRQFGLKLNLHKCLFSGPAIPYLGFTLTPQGVLPGLEKTKAVDLFPEPNSVQRIREFTGLTNYFRHMIPGYARLSSHLTKLTTKESQWKGGPLPPQARQAFLRLKQLLVSKPCLMYPRNDRPFTLSTDASTGSPDQPGGLGAVLTQVDDTGRTRPVAFASRSLKKHEANYGAYLLELAAASWAIDHFSVYLRGQHFTLLTDHKPLTTLNVRQQRTFNRLQHQLCEYQFTIHYREGRNNAAPDALSRNPITVASIQKNILGLQPDQFRKVQRADIQCQLVLQYLKLHRLPNNAKISERILRWARHTVIQDDILYINTSSDGLTVTPKLWVPKAYQNLLIKEAHCSPFAGHMGIDKTYARLQTLYWWPGMQAATQQFISNCLTCQKSKNPPAFIRHHAPQQRFMIPDTPNERVHLDLFGPLQTSSKGHKFVLVITDAFTKYAVLVPIPTKSAESVAKAFFDHWIAYFSCPKIIVSDNGKEFSNKIADTLCSHFNIKHVFTSVAHPQTNSQAESFNRSIIKYMRAMLQNNTLEWERWITPLQIAYNSRVHEAIKQTPFFLTFAQDPRLPYFDLDSKRIPYSDSWADHIFHITRLAWEQAGFHLAKAQNVQIQRSKAGELPKLFSPGDPVLIHNVQHKLQNPKLVQPWSDGYVIHQQVGPVTFQVRNLRNNRLSLIHADRLKLRGVDQSTLPKMQFDFESDSEDTSSILSVPNGNSNHVHRQLSRSPHQLHGRVPGPARDNLQSTAGHQETGSARQTVGGQSPTIGNGAYGPKTGQQRSTAKTTKEKRSVFHSAKGAQTSTKRQDSPRSSGSSDQSEGEDVFYSPIQSPIQLPQHREPVHHQTRSRGPVADLPWCEAESSRRSKSTSKRT